MNRLIISAAGVILTFIWIIYTAPPRQDKLEKIENAPIKKINKSGSRSVDKIRQPENKAIESDTSKSRDYFLTQIQQSVHHKRE